MKTQVVAEDGQQDLRITRTFDLPVDLLFKAFVLPEIIEQWMGTKVLKLESKKGGSFEFETPGPKDTSFSLSGVIHAFNHNESIIRTFEMSNMPFGVQLEVLSFEAVSETRSILRKHVIYESVEKRNENLKLPFKQGVNMAHDRLEKTLKQTS